MFRHSNDIESMFATREGSLIYDRILSSISKEGMEPYFNNGLLVGFSGGADSVFLLSFLKEYQRRTGKTFKLLAVHVNHCIRGDEAKRDEEFSRNFCETLGVEFSSVSVDVPTMKEQLGIGLEEAARNARYSIFNNIISGRNDIPTIAVAHNATDNAETVLMNILRGSGIGGVSGIKPVRDNIVRPILTISKPEILSLLDGNAIPYVTDSTNLSSDYSRNYVRNEILPRLMRLSDNPEMAFTRLTENLRLDLDYLSKQVRDFITDECSNEIYASKLSALHPSIQAKVLSELIHTHTGSYPEEKHISALRELLKTDNFRYSLHGDLDSVCQRGICIFLPKKRENELVKQIFPLSMGENKISGTNLTVYIGEIDKSSLNVYNFSIQGKVSSAIISDSLLLRFKSDGDSYRYSGMTHKLKKVFNDRNIPPIERNLIPVLCDSQGIVLVPGMSERDGAKSDVSTDNIPITFAYSSVAEGETEVFTALLRK